MRRALAGWEGRFRRIQTVRDRAKIQHLTGKDPRS
jgi:hypothetical protein